MSLLAEAQNRKRAPTAVTIKEHIIVLNVNSNRKSVSHGFLAGIFKTLDQYGVAVDLISTSEVHVSMAIDDGLTKKIEDRLTKDLKKIGTVGIRVVLRQVTNIVFLRCLYTATWPSYRWSEERCAIWLV
jgi:aspartate kinase